MEEELGDVTGPSGLHLYNSRRLKKPVEEEEISSYDDDSFAEEDTDEDYAIEEEATEEEAAEDTAVDAVADTPRVDASVLVTQLSQMGEESSSSDEEDLQLSQARREGEKEVKNAAVSSILSLVQMNKAVTSDVRASKKQMEGSAATTTLHGKTGATALQRADSASQPQLSNPRSFLVDYVCRLRVSGSYRFQNSRRIRLSRVYGR